MRRSRKSHRETSVFAFPSAPTSACRTLLLTAAALGLATAIAAPGSAAAEESLREGLGDVGVGKHWIYGDWEAAKAKAARERKPIFALFR